MMDKDLKQDVLKDEELKVTTEEDLDLEKEASEDEEKLNAEIDSLKNQLVRLQADFTNYRNRSKKIELESVGIGIEKMAESLFPVIDNFEIALSHIEDPSTKEGVQMIYNQIIEALKSQGIELMETKDVDFDPNLHYAVMMEEVDGVENGKIIETLKTGFVKDEKVLRPAMVKVSK